MIAALYNHNCDGKSITRRKFVLAFSISGRAQRSTPSSIVYCKSRSSLQYPRLLLLTWCTYRCGRNQTWSNCCTPVTGLQIRRIRYTVRCFSVGWMIKSVHNNTANETSYSFNCLLVYATSARRSILATWTSNAALCNKCRNRKRRYIWRTVMSFITALQARS